MHIYIHVHTYIHTHTRIRIRIHKWQVISPQGTISLDAVIGKEHIIKQAGKPALKAELIASWAKRGAAYALTPTIHV